MERKDSELLDTAEQEEAFFRYENNFLVRQSGYYIYYRKKYPDAELYAGKKSTITERRAGNGSG